MNRIKKYKTEIIILSILSAAGIGYFIYSRIRIKNLNNKVQDLQEFKKQIDNLPDVQLGPNDTIPPNPDLFPVDVNDSVNGGASTNSNYSADYTAGYEYSSY
jgi:hypothetical protein